MNFKALRCAENGDVILMAFEPMNFWARAKGLLGRKSLAPEHGMFFRNCKSIHMFGMRFPIDAIFLDASGRVLKVVHELQPWRCAASYRSSHVLEVAAGSAVRLGLLEGRRLVL
ncbi:DUF192 domain-containing protein [Halopseudomonas yangmingensis]|uniref:DUF192 domain-containing protein n=1 Tax=Halopseudomonas yangmingensis TaxID=1720063 RepID=UPI001C432E03|nr:DUF192 domain-containing protein [Halopseudomonas yangmingensis]